MNKETVLEEFARATEVPDEELDLSKTAFLIASMQYPDLDFEHEFGVLDSIAAGASRWITEDMEALQAVNALSRWLFDDLGFAGNHDDYYDPKNSYLNDLLDLRLGIPISLSLLYIEVGRRVGVPLVGIGMPGHFLVRHRDEESLFIDPFHKGILLSVDECRKRFHKMTNNSVPWEAGHLAPIRNRDFIARMLRNLKTIYVRKEDFIQVLWVMNMLVALLPDAAEERRDRGLIHHRLGSDTEALEDLRWFASTRHPGSKDEFLEKLIGDLMGLRGKQRST
ncbi:MAG: transglutaminase-like domain-containing protein [Chloroflexi bacterium]|nr:transglutaminase-like domain-containing protein [Chloroflexota bacterium]